MTENSIKKEESEQKLYFILHHELYVQHELYLQIY